MEGDLCGPWALLEVAFVGVFIVLAIVILVSMTSDRRQAQCVTQLGGRQYGVCPSSILWLCVQSQLCGVDPAHPREVW